MYLNRLHPEFLIHFFIILIIINLACPRPHSKSLLSSSQKERGKNLGPVWLPIPFVIATASPCSQVAFVTEVHPDTELQRETGASGMVRKWKCSASGAALLCQRPIPGKEHTAQPHQPASTTSPARNKPGSFPGNPIPNTVGFCNALVFCSLWQQAAAAAALQHAVLAHRNFSCPVFSDGECQDAPCYTRLLPQVSTFSKFQKLSMALPFASSINYDENSSRANSSRCKTASLFPFFKRHMKQINHQGSAG